MDLLGEVDLEDLITIIEKNQEKIKKNREYQNKYYNKHYKIRDNMSDEEKNNIILKKKLRSQYYLKKYHENKNKE